MIPASEVWIKIAPKDQITDHETSRVSAPSRSKQSEVMKARVLTLLLALFFGLDTLQIDLELGSGMLGEGQDFSPVESHDVLRDQRWRFVHKVSIVDTKVPRRQKNAEWKTECQRRLRRL